ESPIGKEYLKRKDKSVFYRDATFYTVAELVSHLERAGFSDFSFRQTLFAPMEEMAEVAPVKEGHGEGSFVAVRGVKRKEAGGPSEGTDKTRSPGSSGGLV
ncbi:MAG TPA: hypothetical protein VGB23_04545, partial [Nitrospirota bacterium]